uniref:beta-secretase 2 isoform X2 n=1 Tax=Centroberyx gerrardi TaxID=166262 RepID=UPI003AABDD54
MACGKSVLVWAFAFSLCLGVSQCYYTIPLKIYPGKFNSSSDLDLTPLQRIQTSGGNVLSLASDPAGIVNFLDMVNNLQGDSGRGYYMEMSIGTPGQKLNILVDTGSSNFAVAAAPHPFITHYFNTELSSTYQSAGRTVAVRYTQGNWEGELGIDRVSIPNGPNGTITINIAAILSSEGFFLPGVNWQGILGLAYPILARPDSSVEPFFNSMVRQMGIPDVFSLQMCGAGLSASSTADPAGGSLIMGGAEPTLYRGSMWYTPLKEEWYYQVEVLKLEVGDQNLNLDCREYNMDKAIVDSGTTLLRLPVNVFNAVVEAITHTSLLYIQPITDVDGTLDCFRFGVSSSANGLVIGATVMEGFYVVFDRAQRRVGFAPSNCAVNGGAALSEIAGPFSAADVAADCAGGVLKEPLLWLISYALMGVCALVLIILLLLLVLPCRRRDHSGEITDESSLVRHRIK